MEPNEVAATTDQPTPRRRRQPAEEATAPDYKKLAKFAEARVKEQEIEIESIKKGNDILAAENRKLVRQLDMVQNYHAATMANISNMLNNVQNVISLTTYKGD